MFDKLSFSELAQLYTAVADLERHYGKEATHEGMKLMSERLDRKESIKNVSRLDNNFNPVKVVQEQMKMQLAEEPKRKRRNGKPKNKAGYNDHMIRKWCTENNPNMTPEEVVLRKYYISGMTQGDIGKPMGVNQRAISSFIERIPEDKRKTILSQWGIKR